MNMKEYGNFEPDCTTESLGIETTKRLTIDDIDDQRAILETDLSRMSREAQKNALLSENENNNGDTSNGGKTVNYIYLSKQSSDIIVCYLHWFLTSLNHTIDMIEYCNLQGVT